jgi:hypothetical protein
MEYTRWVKRILVFIIVDPIVILVSGITLILEQLYIEFIGFLKF